MHLQITHELQTELQSRNISILQPAITVHPDTTIGHCVSLERGIFSVRPLEIGAFTYSRSQVGQQVRRIGRYCSIAEGVSFGGANHPTDRLSSSSFSHDGGFIWKAWNEGTNFVPRFVGPEMNPPIEIGNDVWIALNAFIRTGVTIGDGAVVGAGAVVTKDVPPYAIVAGNPAKIIRMRFPEETVSDLMDIKWWQYDYTDLGTAPLGSIEDAITELHRRLAGGTIKPFHANPLSLRPYCEAQGA